jgi:hypothetical protein
VPSERFAKLVTLGKAINDFTVGEKEEGADVDDEQQLDEVRGFRATTCTCMRQDLLFYGWVKARGNQRACVLCRGRDPSQELGVRVEFDRDDEEEEEEDIDEVQEEDEVRES